MDNTELNGSELGTQLYWQETYAKEITNFEAHGDLGDIWFGEDTVNRVVNWISHCGVEEDVPIIDIGCGNGYSLLELAKKGFTNLLGVDYCSEAIELARKVCQDNHSSIKFQVFDIANNNVKTLGIKFRIAHDKGTYDAVCLNPENPKGNRIKYINQVCDLLEDNGLFVITSCNWTEKELVEHFSEKFELKCVIPTPQFKFGGKVGSVVSSVVFVKIQHYITY